jgi:DNA-binding GntR family transcriptional regulator
VTGRSPIGPLEKVSLVDRIVDVLRDRIAMGEIRPGETLRIEALAREFEVSRTPVREAISALEAHGLVVRRTGHAPAAFFPQRREVLEYYEMRQVLEPLAARLALPNVTEELVARLEPLVEAMEDFATHDWYGINREFHETLYRAADRPFLLETIDNLIRRSDPYIRMYFKTHDLEETQRGHRRILGAVARRDEAGLSAAVAEHLQDVVQGILEVIDDDDPA